MNDLINERSLTPGDVLCGRYVVERLAGVGAMGEVFVVDDTWLEALVAFKVPTTSGGRDSGDRARLCVEAAMAQRVTHPNVCRTFDVVEHGGMAMLKMELIRGRTLSQVLATPTPSLEAANLPCIARELCEGVDAIHRTGVVHRDLKPGNVMIDQSGRAVIIDFGIADRACAPRSPRSGTEGYMAPEQLMGAAATPQSDLFSLGLVLFELFLGRPPFVAESSADLLWLQQEGQRFAAREVVDPAVRRAISACLEADPAARPRSARAVAELLPEPVHVVRRERSAARTQAAEPGAAMAVAAIEARTSQAMAACDARPALGAEATPQPNCRRRGRMRRRAVRGAASRRLLRNARRARIPGHIERAFSLTRCGAGTG